MKIEIIDPFGTTMADGELTVADVPGIDETTPSTRQELDARFVGKRLTVNIPDGNPNVLYSIRVS